MTVNLTEFVTLNTLQNDWEVKGWWVGWIGERVCLVPLGDSGIHISPKCPCHTSEEIISGTLMQVHNAFDGRNE